MVLLWPKNTPPNLRIWFGYQENLGGVFSSQGNEAAGKLTDANTQKFAPGSKQANLSTSIGFSLS